MKKRWTMYNKSAEDMSEVKSDSAELVVFSPPYNIGTRYGNNFDQMPLHEYIKMIQRTINECTRVLSSNGTLLLEVADSVLMEDGTYVQLAGMLQQMVLDSGLHLSERHINFVNTKNGVELPESDRWQGGYVTKSCAHSNCHQQLVFSKLRVLFSKGMTSYFNYVETENHPCPFTDEVCRSILDRYFSSPVVEPFAGTANLGRHVLNRGGEYIGYEIDKKIYRYAIDQLKLL